MENIALIVPLFFAIFVVLELLRRKFSSPTGNPRDTWLDIAAWAQSWFLVAPLVVYGGAALQQWLLPTHAGAWSDTPWWLQFAAFLVVEDMVQYWYHRSCHAFPKIWGLHKLHHTAPYMGVRIIWRNGFFYDLLMPNLWFASILVYLGFGQVYFIYFVLKTVVSMAAHSELRWDAVLYRYRALSPLAWIIERTISTPATHFAHHAATEDDGIGHYHGNFGNLLFFWDVLFGTAHITRRYPERFGLELEPGESPDPWHVLIFYPLVRTDAAPRTTSAETPDDVSRSS
ncbi:MAG: sterol desaturase family protein [Pseudomonadota bacterium]